MINFYFKLFCFTFLLFLYSDQNLYGIYSAKVHDSYLISQIKNSKYLLNSVYN